ncbi:hypothetical protein V8E55_010105 [Tylopilus felleus]
MAPVSTQPLSSSMSAHSVELCNGEKSANQCHFHLASKGQCACAADSTSARQRACHTRLRKLLFPIALFLLAVGGTLVISCVYDIDLFDLVNLGADMSGSPLGKRQSVTNGQSTFTRQKLYLIIVFVGLFLVLMGGVMLSYWCCRGSFENPLCFPCYLCACCGGLACLECVGCGLCVAAAELA